MSASLQIQNNPNNCGLHHLVEAATALTQLVSSVPHPKPNNTNTSTNLTTEIGNISATTTGTNTTTGSLLSHSSSSNSIQAQTHTHTISDDEDMMRRARIASQLQQRHQVQQQQQVQVQSQLNVNAIPIAPNCALPIATPRLAEKKTTTPTCMREIFPQRLMRILSDPSISAIITWLPHGRSFVIIQQEVLAIEVLPRYFPESASSSSKANSASAACKYPSFTRKLNRWGFRQVTRGPDAGAFHHKFFRRDEPRLCLQMICQRSRRRKSDEKAQPINRAAIPGLQIPPYTALTMGSTNETGVNVNVNGNSNNVVKVVPTMTSFPNAHNAFQSQQQAQPRLPVQNTAYRVKSPPIAMNVNASNLMHSASAIVSNTASPTPKLDVQSSMMNSHSLPSLSNINNITNSLAARAHGQMNVNRLAVTPNNSFYQLNAAANATVKPLTTHPTANAPMPAVMATTRPVIQPYTMMPIPQVQVNFTNTQRQSPVSVGLPTLTVTVPTVPPPSPATPAHSQLSATTTLRSIATTILPVSTSASMIASDSKSQNLKAIAPAVPSTSLTSMATPTHAPPAAVQQTTATTSTSTLTTGAAKKNLTTSEEERIASAKSLLYSAYLRALA